MTLTIIIPAHNEENIIKKTLLDLEQALQLKHSVLVIDDHSTDQTAQVVEKLAQTYPNLRLIKNQGEPGFANALKLGFANARGDLIVPIMADLCDDPKTIKAMFEKISDGFDVVCGSRYMPGGEKINGPLIQDFFSRYVGMTIHLLTGIPTHDVSNSFKMYKKNVLTSINIESKGFEISMEATLKAYYQGFKIAEVPTVWNGRTVGHSKFYLYKAFLHYFPLYLRAIFRRKSMRTTTKGIYK